MMSLARDSIPQLQPNLRPTDLALVRWFLLQGHKRISATVLRHIWRW